MKIDVQIISTQLIEPSSPTPQHLKIFKLSLLDQLIPAPYAPIILFYSSDHEIVPDKLELLKKSLSDTLTRFYPLAGRIKNDLSIVCSDEGAYFVEALVNCRFDEFLEQPDLLVLSRFLPRDFNSKEPTAGTYVTNIQVNMFRCGGIAIGVCISHKILDGASLSTFLKAWTAAARDCKETIINPNFISTTLFPTADDLRLRNSSLVMWGSLFKKGKSVTRRIVFGASSMAALTARATISGKYPTRVNSVSAFLWKCTMAASKERNGFHRASLLTHLVNLRRRMAYNTENSTGNLM
ncbi:glucan endo-1,3-beta-D-glucosidase precursor [Hibiscus syriacus]|uniref:Glucan endo-1,3-beta-D-glucosidase n=1 Tax=Hibiscus syriacus TaxID=106335 RepID=A0A6A3D696_HIBSY|nr:glucan endo-1,3-beta-D-glucosidase precursor [Hibiscus syriacus]